MDSSNGNGGFHRTHNSTSSKGAFRGAHNLEAQVTHPPRLQKQRSNAGMRSVSHGQPLSSTFHSVSSAQPTPSATAFGDGTKARKGSIRNAVRKIFGRRSRDVISQPPEISAPPPASRHNYHRSEPTALVPTREEPELYVQNTNFVERTLSDPYQAIPSPPFNRTGSPYAVQFPNSVRLKPMDLGNPFIPGVPPNQLRRRKTLPSMLLTEREEEGMSADDERESPEVKRQQPVATGRETPTRAPKRTPSHIKKARRKSRSTDDLQSSTNAEDLLRKRSEEIRYWREGFQPDVLRASGFTTRNRQEDDAAADQVDSLHRKSPSSARQDALDEEEKDAIPMPQMTNSMVVSRSGTLRSSPPTRLGGAVSASEVGDLRPSSGAGTELSKDLEDRVAKLEAGLQNFQRSLQRLTAERNRRTIIMGSIATRRSSNDMRTPSLLADTLSDPLEPSSYQYDFGHTMRPSTSPPPPHAPAQTQGTLEDPFGPELPKVPEVEHPLDRTSEPRTERPPDSFPMPSPLNSHPPNQQPPAPSSSASRSQPQPYTFSSLYQMLADERSARRKLEQQLRGLKQEITDLHSQVATSNVQSARSSYMLAGSSSRLQELLRETEAESSPRSAQRDSGLSALGGGGGAVISRFSGSESEAGPLEYEELVTPYEAYQTPPSEKRSKQSLKLDPKDDDMF